MIKRIYRCIIAAIALPLMAYALALALPDILPADWFYFGG